MIITISLFCVYVSECSFGQNKAIDISRSFSQSMLVSDEGIPNQNKGIALIPAEIQSARVHLLPDFHEL
jgi:hypothetical protein